MRKCKDCEMSIENRGNRAIRCKECQNQYRKEYNKNLQNILNERHVMRKGSKNPFKIDSEGCGNNKKKAFPRKKRPYMAYWYNDNGEPMDKYLIERGKAIDKLNKRISFIPDEIVVERARKEVYKDWVY